MPLRRPVCNTLLLNLWGGLRLQTACSSAGASRCLARLAPPTQTLPPLHPHRAHGLAVGLLEVVTAQLHSRVCGGGNTQRGALPGLRGGSARRPQRVDAASRQQPRRQPAAAAEAHGLALHHPGGLHPAGSESALHLWPASFGRALPRVKAPLTSVQSAEAGVEMQTSNRQWNVQAICAFRVLEVFSARLAQRCREGGRKKGMLYENLCMLFHRMKG